MRSGRTDEAAPREEDSQGANYVENLHFCQATLARHRQGSPSNLGQTLQLQPQSTWPRAMAATAENTVMPRAVIGFWPWAMAKVVITPAPRQATASWVTIEGRLFI